jgi:hypothetical protein
LRDKEGDATSESSRLAAAGPRDYEKRPVAVCDGASLGLV